MRLILLGTGWLATSFGAAGIFLPLLPTTPFLLLATACFARSSPRAQRWLLNAPHLGPVLRDYLEHRKVSRRAKAAALLLLWPGVGWTAAQTVATPLLSGGLLILAAIVTVFIVSRPSARFSEDDIPAQ